MDNKRYVKITYKTNPIGEYKIVLFLTTFDLEAYKKDQQLKETHSIAEIPIGNKLDKDSFVFIENRINDYIKNYYEPKIEELQMLIEAHKRIRTPIPLTNVKNINNCDNIHCNIIYGNISNCDNIYCNEIKGNVINCDRIFYQDRSV